MNDLDRVPVWADPRHWLLTNTPPGTLVEADRRIEADEPRECTSFARTGLRIGAVVLCWNDQTRFYFLALRPRITVISGGPIPGHELPWRAVYADCFYDDAELLVLL